MKRTVSILMTLGLAAGMVFADVKSQNAVGYYTLTIPPAGGFIMMGVAVKNVASDAPTTLLDVFGTDQLEQSTSLGECDLITIWDPDTSTYQSYAQYDGVFYKANDLSEWGVIQANPEVPTGSAMWLVGVATPAERHITVVGEAIDTETATLGIKEGFQMITVPYSASIHINDTGFYASGAASSTSLGDCDLITVWDPDTATYQSYATYEGVWYKANDLSEWGVIEADIDLELGQGFWYVAQADYDYTENRPYTLDLD